MVVGVGVCVHGKVEPDREIPLPEEHIIDEEYLSRVNTT